MAPPAPSKPRKAPSTVADFTILPLTLPTLPGLPSSHQNTHHYLYLKPHSPSTFTPTSERSLFLANIPIDATSSNIRALFADQLGGARVESVEFDASIPAKPLHKRWKSEKRGDEEEGEVRGKKRKRNDAEVVAEGVVEDEESALPSLWGSEVRRSGSAAVVLFVDRRSARGALKEAMSAVKEGRAIYWKSGSGLGVERKSFSSILPSALVLTQSARLQNPPHPNLPVPHRPPILHKRVPHPIHRPRNHALQAPQTIPHRSRRRRLHNSRARRALRARAPRRRREEES